MSELISKIIPIRWDDSTGELIWLDTSQIPWKEVYVSSKSIDRIAKAIKTLEVRGSAILGEVGAYGIAIAANNSPNKNKLLEGVRSAADVLVKTRPTAVNLSWGINRVVNVVQNAFDNGSDLTEIKEEAIREAKRVQEENIAATIKIGEYGKDLIHDGGVLMTVCNAGTLACDGLGTATAPLRAAWKEGKRFSGLVTYTAPLYQGARLTAWELYKDGIPLRVISDNATGHLIREKSVASVWAGADRILTDGNVFNKIGTFNLGILMHHLGGKLYVAAPTSTIDPVAKAEDVRIEERSQDEIKTVMHKVTIVPEEVETLNPAFDRTPPELVTAIITELGVARAPYESSLNALISREGSMVKARKTKIV